MLRITKISIKSPNINNNATGHITYKTPPSSNTSAAINIASNNIIQIVIIFMPPFYYNSCKNSEKGKRTCIIFYLITNKIITSAEH